MQVDRAGRLHLTYCTNIHPGQGWQAVAASLARYAPALKKRFSPADPFGIGLRLSALDARELLDGHLDEFREFLEREGLYVAIINGFPFGSFHGGTVKADVYAPDWRENARVHYTLDLIQILSRILPTGLDGGISTAPLSYKPWMQDAGEEDWQRVTANVVRVAEALVRLRLTAGTFIHLDIEPEPDCAIENTDEVLAFFEQWLLPYGAPRLAGAIGISVEEARQALLDHVRICFDCCHFAVEFEDPLVALERLSRAGIQIGRVQLSSAIHVDLAGDGPARASAVDRLRQFADPVYLHQVIARERGTLTHFPDLADALQHSPSNSPPSSSDTQWRVHFHVPLFAREYDGLASTQDYVRTVIRAARAHPFTSHLEIETYTWDVLPADLKIDLLESIGREYDWVLSVLR
ncbi:MAG: metabolite traffic protein EboE [Vicinamibacterales bacterium]